MIYLLDLYEREPLSILGAAILWGGVAATTLSIYTNTPLAELIFKITADPAFTSDWSAALTAPFVEEGFKAVGVVLLVSIARAEMDDILDGFVWGAMVGLGFLLVEDVFYFVRAFVEAGVVRGPVPGLPDPDPRRRAVQPLPVHRADRDGRRVLRHPRRRRPEPPPPRRVGAGGRRRRRALLLELADPRRGSRDGSIVGWFAYVTVKGLPMLIGLLILVRLARRRQRRWLSASYGRGRDDGTITADELRDLGGVRARWRARRAAARLKGAAGGGRRPYRAPADQPGDGRQSGRAPDHPDVVQQRDVVRALKAEYAALPVAVGPVPVCAGGAAPLRRAGQRVAVPAQPACRRSQRRGPAGRPAQPRSRPRSPRSVAAYRRPRHLQPHRRGVRPIGSPTKEWPRGPTGPVVAPVATSEAGWSWWSWSGPGDWLRVAAVNGWTGGLTVGRLVPRG